MLVQECRRGCLPNLRTCHAADSKGGAPAEAMKFGWRSADGTSVLSTGQMEVGEAHDGPVGSRIVSLVDGQPQVERN